MSETGHNPLVVRHPDRRIARTQSALVNALTDLARTRPVREISVRQLVDHAQIGRSTFYEHFESIEDLLCWLVDGLVVEVVDDAGAFRLDTMLAFVTGMPEVTRAFLQIQSCAERCETALAEALPGSDPSTRRFAAAGTMALLTQWLDGTDPRPVDELIASAVALTNTTCLAATA